MWTILSADDTERLERCAAIMQRMDRAYATQDAAYFGWQIVAQGMEIHFYESGDLTLVLMTCFNPRLRRWRVWTGGFEGPISPCECCQLGMDRLRDIMDHHNIESVYTIRRFGLDYQPLDDVYHCVRAAIGYELRVEHRLADCEVWDLRLVERPVASRSGLRSRE